MLIIYNNWFKQFLGRNEDEEMDNEALREEVLPANAQRTTFNAKKFRDIVKRGDCILGKEFTGNHSSVYRNITLHFFL